MHCYLNGFIKRRTELEQTKINARVVWVPQSDVRSLCLVKVMLNVASDSDV